MVKYTRMHFEDVAALISKIPEPEKQKMVNLFSAKFSDDNPRFDSGKFRKACGV